MRFLDQVSKLNIAVLVMIGSGLLLSACGGGDEAQGDSPDVGTQAMATTDDSPSVKQSAPSVRPTAATALSGINFPPTQGTTNSGAFLPGVYRYGYTTTQIRNANPSFSSMRLPINVETANSPAALAQLKSYVDQFQGKHAIICMFDTLTGSQTGHGDGLPNNLDAMGAAWAKIHAVFASYPNVRYEIFNEPFGYSKSDPVAYVRDMKYIISKAGLPGSKTILDGMGYADDIDLVVQGGWSGDLAYHFYPTWSSDHSQEAFSNKAQTDLGRWSKRTWITEFGANLGWNSSNGYTDTCYGTYIDANKPYSANVNALRGLDDALRSLKGRGQGVKGTFVWHGWHNDDSYDFWASKNANGACKVRKIQAND
jgi:hypothetical protein